MINMTPESILDFLQKNNYEADIEKDTRQVYTIFKMNKKEFPLFLRIFDEGHLLQILIFIPSHLQANEGLISEGEIKNSTDEIQGPSQKSLAKGDLARLLHLLNKELDIPGLGMDEIAGVVFYRLMLPSTKKKIDSELLLAFIKTSENVCQMFSTPIEAVSSGQMTLDEILAKTQETQKPVDL